MEEISVCMAYFKIRIVLLWDFFLFSSSSSYYHYFIFDNELFALDSESQSDSEEENASEEKEDAAKAKAKTAKGGVKVTAGKAVVPKSQLNRKERFISRDESSESVIFIYVALMYLLWFDLYMVFQWILFQFFDASERSWSARKHSGDTKS